MGKELKDCGEVLSLQKAFVSQLRVETGSVLTVPTPD